MRALTTPLGSGEGILGTSFFFKNFVSKMDGNSSSDDDEIKHIQNQIEYKTSRKRKEPPPASVPEIPEPELQQQQIQNPATVEVPENVPQSTERNKRNREVLGGLNFAWLELVGPTCYSVKQAKAGIDLSHLKKKYRNMRCITCAQHNPSTPWAELWPRKFELQTLIDHAKSGAHIKADTALKTMPEHGQLLAEQNPPVFKVVSGSGKALQLDKALRDEVMETHLPAVDASGFDDLADDDGSGKANANVRIRGVTNSIGAHIVAHSTRIRPDWLYSEGNLCLSDKQLTDPNLPLSTKKKYKQMACLYCREYVPDSLWANLRPRKFESAVIGDHERSAVHQKAIELRLAQLSGVGGGGDMSEMHQLDAMRTAHEILRQQQLQLQQQQQQMQLQQQMQQGEVGKFAEY